MSTQEIPDLSELRDEIQSAIAAGRELGPEMDRHLADSVLERYRKEHSAEPKAVAKVKPSHQDLEASDRSLDVGSVIITVAGMIAFLVLLIVQPGLWWLIFLVPAVFGMCGWDFRSRRRSRRRRRLESPTVRSDEIC